MKTIFPKVIMSLLIIVTIANTAVSKGEQSINTIDWQINLEMKVPEGYCGYQKYNNQNLLEYMVEDLNYEGVVLEITIAQSDIYRETEQLSELDENELNKLAQVFACPSDSMLLSQNASWLKRMKENSKEAITYLTICKGYMIEIEVRKGESDHCKEITEADEKLAEKIINSIELTENK